MQPKSIVGKFIEELASTRDPQSTIAIKISDDPSLELRNAATTAEGVDWLDHVQPNHSFEFVVVDLPLGMARRKIDIGGSTISVRSNWAELSKALHLLAPNGLCVAVVEPPAFGIAEGPIFQKALAKEGLNRPDFLGGSNL